MAAYHGAILLAYAQADAAVIARAQASLKVWLDDLRQIRPTAG